MAELPPLQYSLREQIASHLRNEILAGQFKENERLREEMLSKRYKTSRGPVRDALLQLSKEGLLIGQPNRGVRVRPSTHGKVRELMVRLRREIETFALDILFKDITKEDLVLWASYLKKFREACRSSNIVEVVEFDLAFHRSIVGKVGQEDLLSVWTPLITHLFLPYSRHERLLDSYDEHMAIVNAIKKRDKKAAMKLLMDNIQ